MVAAALVWAAAGMIAPAGPGFEPPRPPSVVEPGPGGEPGSLILRAGAAVRARVDERLDPADPRQALLAGFLVGDTSGLDESDIAAMRRTGLSHFVAVSGSNVALFLGLVALAAGPLALGPRRRALVGLAALPVYAAATGFEPSVLRASAMAGLALAGRLAGIVLEAWQLLALAVVVLLIAEPALARSVGFQLSVAATAGVLVGSRWPIDGGTIRRALAVTVGAQAAVAPLVLAHFEVLPMVPPLANLMAAPLVTVATVLGAIGVAGVTPLLWPAIAAAGWVLGIARGLEATPQLGPAGLAIATMLGTAYLALPRARSFVLGVGAVGVTVGLIGLPSPLPEPGVVVLDVGQGDAILVNGGPGNVALVDGGPDGLVLRDRLREYGVQELALVVLTHVHADHAGGLIELIGRVPVGLIWLSSHPHETPASRRFEAVAAAAGIPVQTPRPGEALRLGALHARVEGPLRRYASPNDQSIVMTVTGPTGSMLLAGDIEVTAQRDLMHLRADVLKVPHQGAATSDPGWLEAVGAGTAVVSVGPNPFGHPADWVISLLESSGASVLRTDVEGDVAVPLG